MCAFWDEVNSATARCFLVFHLYSQRLQAIKYWGSQKGKKNHWFAWRTNQWPLVRLTLFPYPATPLSLFWTLEWLFWADAPSFTNPWFVSWVASGTPEIPGHRQVRSNRCKGPRTLSRTTDPKNWLCVCWKHRFFVSWGSLLGLSLRPPVFIRWVLSVLSNTPTATAWTMTQQGT